MLVDEDDEDEEEVSGHTQEADGGQQDGADCVLLETRKNCRNLPLAVKLNLYNLTRTNYQHNVASVPGIVMMVIMTADVSGYLSACDLNAPLLLKVRRSSGAGEIPLCPDNCHQAVSPDTG